MNIYYIVKYTSCSSLSYINFKETRICMLVKLVCILYFINIKFWIQSQMLYIIIFSKFFINMSIKLLKEININILVFIAIWIFSNHLLIILPTDLIFIQRILQNVCHVGQNNLLFMFKVRWSQIFVFLTFAIIIKQFK